MAQEGRGNPKTFPGSIFEIDELDATWEGNEPSGVDLMREPSLMPEPDSEVQAASVRPTNDAACEEESAFPDDLAQLGFEEALPLVHPDGEPAAPAAEPVELAHAVRRTGPVDPTRRTGPISPTVRRTGPTDPTAAPPSERTTSPGDPLLNEVRDRYAMGDYSGALIIAEGILANDANNGQAKRYVDNCRQVLEQMYCAKIGPLSQRPEVGVSADQLRWLSLDHRAGFLLSLIDGSSSVEELLDISGMPRFEALRTLCDLLEQNVITLAR